MDEKEMFKKILLDDSYITWLSDFMKNKKTVDNLYYVCNPETKISCDDIKKLEYLNFLYDELLVYFIKNREITSNTKILSMRYKNKYYIFEENDGCCSCEVSDEPLYIDKHHGLYYTSKCFDYLEPLSDIKYEELKEQYTLEDKANAKNIKITDINKLK